jgi:predicted regulator of Ras-like GTPase activity (Roadblock/LC7/MglB family)
MRSTQMRDLEQVASLPGVRSAVLGDLGGALVNAVRDTDGETVAAVTGFLSTTLVHVGEQLGLGTLRRATIASPSRAWVVVVQGGTVIAACVEPPGALAAVEKGLETPGHRER